MKVEERIIVDYVYQQAMDLISNSELWNMTCQYAYGSFLNI